MIVSFFKKLLNTKPVGTNLSIALAGNNVECVCCSGTFITFLPSGLIKRANALCPNCQALERHRLHWHYMIHNTNLKNLNSKVRLLHVSPEKVFYDKFIENPLIDYFPVAKFGEGYEDAYPPKTSNLDLTDINFPDNSFDIIYCSHVLEHIPADLKAMTELYRVLKPGGWALLQVPVDRNRDTTFEDDSITDPDEREKYFGQKDHVRVYGKDYKQRLVHAGFTVREENYTAKFTENEIFRFGFMKDEHIYYCSKC
jgi:SAM-dependent methyltransferase